MLNTRIDQLIELIKKDPDNTLFLYTLGLEYIKSGNAAKAIAPLKKTIEINPDYFKAYRELGKALSLADHKKTAVEIYQKGIEVADKCGDVQTKKEMQVFLKRLLKEKR